MKKIVLLLALMAVLAGCASMAPRAESADKQRIYEADYDMLFNAAKAVLLENECKITLASKDSGILQAEKILMSRIFAEMFAPGAGAIYKCYDLTFLPGSQTTIYLENYVHYKDGSGSDSGRQDEYLRFWMQLEEKL